MTDVETWLADWAAAIRARDFERARTMFAEGVVAFGSLTGAMEGREALEREQWRPIWTATRGFAFDPPTAMLDDGRYVIVACTWSSEGQKRDGGWYHRSGRATLVLHRVDGVLRCVHSHFSMMPGIPAIDV